MILGIYFKNPDESMQDTKSPRFAD